MTPPERVEDDSTSDYDGSGLAAWIFIPLAIVLVLIVSWIAVVIDTKDEQRIDAERRYEQIRNEPVPTVTVTVTPRPARASRAYINTPERLAGIKPDAPRIVCRIGSPPKGAAKRLAYAKVPRCQWPCLRELWERESGWSSTALGPVTRYGRAYGIAQSMGMKPGTTMETQVRLGLKYIAHRYGSPCRALAAHDRKGWY